MKKLFDVSMDRIEGEDGKTEQYVTITWWPSVFNVYLTRLEAIELMDRMASVLELNPPT